MYVCMCMYVGHICRYCRYCTRPLGHGNHHHVPKTPSCDPAPGGTNSGTLLPHLCPSRTPDFEHPPRSACVLGPFGRPLLTLGGDLRPLSPRRSFFDPCHNRSQAEVVAPQHPDGLGRSSPSKTPPDRDWLARGPKTPSLGPAPGGPTQGIPGHVPIHFIRPSRSHCRTQLCAPHASMWRLYVWVCAGMCMCRYV
jgi:hypothetical protein